MRRCLPRLEQIEAFIEAAAGPNFRAAADRCALSPAAFSRRIQAFSDHVGVSLFERTAGGSRLTEAGRHCLADLEPAFLELRRAARAVGNRAQQSITLSLSHSLAVGWLIPRIERFREDHPEIDLSFRTDRGTRSVRGGEADIGICFSDVDIAGLEQQPLLDVVATPVASPALSRTVARDGLDQQRLLALSTPADLWQWWITETGLPAPGGQTTRFELIHALYETASQGLGVALGASPTVWPYLESGKLERIGLPTARFPGGYHLVASADRKRSRAVATTWRWLEAQAAVTPQLC